MRPALWLSAVVCASLAAGAPLLGVQAPVEDLRDAGELAAALHAAAGPEASATGAWSAVLPAWMALVRADMVDLRSSGPTEALCGGCPTGVATGAWSNAASPLLDGSFVYGGVARVGEGGLVVVAPAGGDQQQAFLLGGLVDPAPVVGAAEDPAVDALREVLLREHNRRALALAASLETDDDDELFAQARALVVWQIQRITFEEALPALGVAAPTEFEHDPSLDANVTAEFAAALLPWLRTQTHSVALEMDGEGDVVAVRPAGSAALGDSDAEAIVRGAMAVPALAVDSAFAAGAVHEFPLSAGLDADLLAADLLVGRSLGLARPVNATASADTGLLLLDDPEALAQVLLEQLERTRAADLAWYTLSGEAAAAVDGVTLSTILNWVFEDGEVRDDAFAAGSPLPPPDPSSLPVIRFSTTLLHGDYALDWEIVPGTDYVTVTVGAPTKGFVGIGFGPSTEGMVNADAVVCRVVDDVPETLDAFAAAPSVVHIDEEQNVELVSGSQVDGYTSCTFMRPLAASEGDDRPIETEGSTGVIVSFGSSDALQYHGLFNRQYVAVDFFSGGLSPSESLLNVGYHGGLMAATWLVGISTGVIIARYFKRFSWWLNVHKAVQAGSATTLLPTMLIAVANESNGQEHFAHRHGVIGLTIVITALVQVALGVYSVSSYDPDRKKVPIFPDMMHRFLGRSLFLLAIINVYFGIDRLGLAPPFRTAYFVWIGLLGSVFVSFELAIALGYWDREGQPDTIVEERVASQFPLQYQAVKKARTAFIQQQSQAKLRREASGNAGNTEETPSPKPGRKTTLTSEDNFLAVVEEAPLPPRDGDGAEGSSGDRKSVV